MKIKNLLLFSVGMLLPAFVLADASAPVYVPPPEVTTTEIHGAVPAESAHIAKYYVANAAKGSGYETGDLHILYSDKTEVVETLAPRTEARGDEIVDNEAGFKDVRVADDGRTIAWLKMQDGCCQSYSIPVELAVYHSGNTIMHIDEGQVVWYWAFLEGGKQVVAVWSANHGPFVGHYERYDTATGKLLGEVFGDPRTQSLDADAPAWALQVEADCRRCGNHRR